MSESFKINRKAEAASIDRGVTALVPDRAVALRLFRNARSLAKRKRDPNWVFAMSLYGVGSTYGWAICERIGVNPIAISADPAALTPADRGETQAVGGGWLPISTAPKNQRVLIYRVHPDGGCDQTAMAYLSAQDKLWFTMPEEHFVDFAPTHWRPLPKPPSPDQNRGEPDQGGANTEAGR